MQPKKKRFVVAFTAREALEDTLSNNFKGQHVKNPDPKKLVGIKGISFTKRGVVFNSSRMRAEAYLLFENASETVRNAKDRQRRVNMERLLIMKQLKSLGFSVLTPKYSFSHPEFLEKSKGVAKSFPARVPHGGFIGAKTLAHSSSTWARDLWVKTKHGRIRKFGPNFAENNFGEGGMVVPIGQNDFLVSYKLRNDPTVMRFAREHKVKFHFLKDGLEFDAKMSKFVGTSAFMLNDHIDLFVGTVGKVILVNKHFFAENSGVLKAAARENKLSIVFIPENEENIHPANMLVIGENRALVDREAKETISLLKAHGVDVVPTVVPLKANRDFGGGVRCLVNEL